MSGNVSIVPVSMLVLDPALQCRAAGVDAGTVSEYADTLKAAKSEHGEPFPPLEAVRVDGVAYLTDGWQRHAAAELAGLANVHVRIVDGTRRDALMAAAKANATHGLPRSNADKRRAVAILLQDEEWCQISNRDAGVVVGVSHTYVGNLRKEYGVKVGELLTPARRAAVDGERPPEWEALFRDAPKWDRVDIEAIRLAPNVEALARLGRAVRLQPAFYLRAAELGRATWPWPEDGDDTITRTLRVAGLDTIPDLERALNAEGCPDRATVYAVLKAAYELVEEKFATTVEYLLRPGGYFVDEFGDKRPRLAQLGRARLVKLRQERDAKEAKDPHVQARRIVAIQDEAEQLAALKAAAKEVLDRVDPFDLAPPVRDGWARARIGLAAVDCKRPGCGGWVVPNHWKGCVLCHTTARELQTRIDEGLSITCGMLEEGGHGIRVQPVGHEVVTLDREAVCVLAELDAAIGDKATLPVWLARAPAMVRDALLAWRAPRELQLWPEDDGGEFDEEADEAEDVETLPAEAEETERESA